MTIRTRQVGDVAVLQLAGKLAVSADGSTVRTAVQEAMHRGAARLLLHLGAVTGADSSGLGDLVSAHTGAKNSGATVKLCSVPPGFVETLKITQLITLFDIYDSEADAIASFAQ